MFSFATVAILRDMTHSLETIANIKQRLSQATPEEFVVLERSLAADTRKGVQETLRITRKRFAEREAEQTRLEKLYSFQNELTSNRVSVGLDEVGRGPLAGPLSVGAVVLPSEPLIEGLDDSKKIPEYKREAIAENIKQIALGWAVEHIEPHAIDAAGITASLRVAFLRAVSQIEAQGIHPAVILLDGNPLHLDDREINVIKGDSTCASIAAASIVAKVERDALMREYAQKYPAYHLESCKGYASAEHIEAIKKYGLSPIHRKSFCGAFLQDSLF